MSSPETGSLRTEIRSNLIAGHFLADIWFIGKGNREATIGSNTVGLSFAGGSLDLPDSACLERTLEQMNVQRHPAITGIATRKSPNVSAPSRWPVPGKNAISTAGPSNSASSILTPVEEEVS